MTAAANETEWFDELDLVDPFFGSIDELNALAVRAPTPELSAWLRAQIAENQTFLHTHFPANTIAADAAH